MSTTVTIGSGKSKERKERIKERLKRGGEEEDKRDREGSRKGSMKKRRNEIEKDQGKGQ